MWITMFRKKKLRGKRIAVLIADGFERIELTVPLRALRLSGAIVEIISLRRGKIRGMNLTEPAGKVRARLAVDEANPSQYDGLLIPGGFVGPDFLRQSAAARSFVRAIDEAQKPIATLCHGPWLLASADLVRGRRLASWPGIRDDLVHAGAVWRDEAVVYDRNWVTSRGPQDLRAFVPAMHDLFAGDLVQQAALPSDAVSSPQYEHPLKPALLAARLLPGPLMGTVTVAAALALGVRRAL